MKKFFIGLVAILFCVIGCQNIDYIVIESNSDSCKVLELDPVFNQPCITLYDVVDTIKVIALETTSASILSDINSVKMTDEYIFINDEYQHGSISIFDINGKFVRRLPHGNGPGELNAVRDFDFDGNYLYTLQIEKVNKYTLLGDYVESYPVLEMYNKYFQSLKTVDDGFLFSVHPLDSKLRKYEVVYTDKNLKRKNTFVFNLSFVGMGSFRHFQTLQGDVVFFPSMCNTVYKFDGNTFRPFYVLNYPKHANTFETNPDGTGSGLDFREKHCIPQKYFPNGTVLQSFDILFFNFEDGMTLFDVYLDTKSCKFRSGIGLSPDDTPVWLLKWRRMMCTYNDYFVQVLPPELYLRAPYGLDLDVEGKHLEESVSQLQHISDEDKKKILNAKEDDNPLIIMYKLKSIE